MTDFALPTVLPGGSLEGYLQRINSIPMLSAEEEQRLAERYRDEEDIDAARSLVLSHLRFVAKVARGYNGYGLPLGDLIQEGNIGLMKAVKRFDPTIGVRLVSFAVHWIRAEIHEYIIRNWRIVKVATTKAQRKLFFNLRGAKKRLGWLNRQEVSEVAEDLGVRPEDVMEMEQRLAATDAGFDPVGVDDEDGFQAPAAYLEDLRYEPEGSYARAQSTDQLETGIAAGLASLDERSRAIVRARWLVEDKATLQELAEQYGVSAERIRQIEKTAFGRLRESLGELAG